MNTRNLKKHLKYIVPEIRLALIKEPGIKPLYVNCPEDIEKVVEPLKHYADEHFISLHLNCRNEITGYIVVSHGTVSASLVHPREVFKAAVIANAHGIIVAHNHPAGSLMPSSEDIETTKQLILAGKLLGIGVVDHVIVSSNGFRSMRETEPYLWL